MLIHFFCLKAGNVSLQNFVCSVDLHMQGASANTALPKAKFSRRDSEFGLLRLKIPHTDSLFSLSATAHMEPMPPHRRFLDHN